MTNNNMSGIIVIECTFVESKFYQNLVVSLWYVYIFFRFSISVADEKTTLRILSV